MRWLVLLAAVAAFVSVWRSDCVLLHSRWGSTHRTLEVTNADRVSVTIDSVTLLDDAASVAVETPITLEPGATTSLLTWRGAGPDARQPVAVVEARMGVGRRSVTLRSPR